MNVSRRLFNGFLASIPLYIPVHLIPALLFKHKLLVSSPFKFIWRTATKIAFSSAVLGSFVGINHGCICLVRNLRKYGESSGVLLGCALCGLSILFEQKRRRLDLALYVAPLALQSWWRKLEAHGFVQSVQHFEKLLLAVSLGIVMHCNEHAPGSVRPS